MFSLTENLSNRNMLRSVCLSHHLSCRYRVITVRSATSGTKRCTIPVSLCLPYSDLLYLLACIRKLLEVTLLIVIERRVECLSLSFFQFL